MGHHKAGGGDVEGTRRWRSGLTAAFLWATVVSLYGTPPLQGQSACTEPRTMVETLRMGSIDGDVALTEVMDLEVGKNGDIYLTQFWLEEVSVFTWDGKAKGRIGRAGSGPGEFEAPPRLLGWKGDTLWVSDRFTTHFFLPNGREARKVTFSLRKPEELSRFVPGTPLSDGSFLPKRLITGERVPFLRADSVPLLKFSSEGEILDTLVWVHTPLSRFLILGPDIYKRHPLEWHGRSWLPVDVAPDGSAVVLIGEIRDEETPTSFDLLRIGVNGDTLLRQTIPYEPRIISRGESELLRVAQAKSSAGDYFPSGPRYHVPPPAQANRIRDAVHKAITFPTYYPPARKIVAGVDGSTWLLRQSWPSLVDIWEIYSESGEFQGSAHISEGSSERVPWFPRFRILRASENEVWGTFMGEYDETYVHRYEIQPCSADGGPTPG